MMKVLMLIPYYLSWHYTRGLRNFWGICTNFLWFATNFFSFSVLLRTLFSPYKKLTEKYRGGLDIEKFMESVIVNTMMRIVGFVLRVFVLISGFFAVALLIVIEAAVLVLWLFIPFIIIFFFMIGIIAIFVNGKIFI